MSKIYVLTHCDFEGYGEYFVGCWASKPTFQDLKAAIQNPISAIHCKDVRDSCVSDLIEKGFGGSGIFSYTLSVIGD